LHPGNSASTKASNNIRTQLVLMMIRSAGPAGSNLNRRRAWLAQYYPLLAK
jgi:hypothetical protein